MTLFEYYSGKMEGYFSFDEAGNLYIDFLQEESSRLSEYKKLFTRLDEKTFFISKEEYDRLKQYEVIYEKKDDEDWKQLDYVRRPYYRMRGKSVTKEQVFDIIRRTDNFFREIMRWGEHPDYIGSLNFDNWLIYKNHIPKGYGWIHADGAVGCNAITQKYPTIDEFIDEWLVKLAAFPYLDLIIAVTCWDEVPYECWKREERLDNWEEIYSGDKFYDAVLGGVYVHDKKVEILEKKKAVAKYQEYNVLYGKRQKNYESGYYESHKIVQVDLPYLKRCISSYGIDADAVLGRIPAYFWKEECERNF